MKRWKVLNVEFVERDGWVKVRGYVWVDGKGGKGFEKPLAYIGVKRWR